MRLLLAIVVCLATKSAIAEPTDSVALARRHFDAGSALYDVGKLEDAIAEFKAGYELAPRPQFLLNMAQAYRKLHEIARARGLYERYLATVPKGTVQHAQLEQILNELARETPAIVVAPAPLPAVTTTSDPPTVAGASPHGFARRHWWSFPVSGVVLAGVAVGIYFGVRARGEQRNASIGCFDAARSP